MCGFLYLKGAEKAPVQNRTFQSPPGRGLNYQSNYAHNFLIFQKLNTHVWKAYTLPPIWHLLAYLWVEETKGIKNVVLKYKIYSQFKNGILASEVMQWKIENFGNFCLQNPIFWDQFWWKEANGASPSELAANTGCFMTMRSANISYPNTKM